MGQLDAGATTTPTEITDYTVDTASTDGVSSQGETVWTNTQFGTRYGHYKNIAKINIAINAWATWIVGKGITADPATMVILDGITGWGEDTIHSILWNMLVIKKVNGDSYAEIIRNPKTGTLINLKPLDPASITHVVGTDGLITRYEQISKTKQSNKIIETTNMLHFCNDRVADNIHGQSVIDPVIWNIEAQEEARRVHRKKVKNSGIIGIIEVDSDDTTTMTNLKTPLKKGVEDGNFLLTPKDVLKVLPWDVKIDAVSTITWLNYLDDEMFEMMGIPRPIIGGGGDREGDSKISYLSFEQYYMRAIIELKADFWNQVALRLDINLPASLQNQLADNELKNTSQTGFQPNDTEAGVGA